MKTRVDDAITHFISELIETDDIDEYIQELLDTVRMEYGFDVVYILEKVQNTNSYTYKYASVSKPEYDNTGIHIKISDEDLEEALHMYDDSPVCGYNADSAKLYEVSDCIIHYGFIRKKAHSYDGSIGFQCFTPHIWTEEEKELLIKLGRLFKMILSVPLSESADEQAYAMLELERKQYRNALVQGAEYSFSFDITEGLIREKIITAQGEDIIDDLGLSLPVSYDLINDLISKKYHTRLLDTSMSGCLSCKGLEELFEKGISNPEVEYYKPVTDTYTRSRIVISQNKKSGHLYGLFMATDITEAMKKQERQRQALEDAYKAANQANTAKTKFLANMSHDIRTPMNAIIGMTAIAAAHMDDRERVADCLTKITQSSKHLLGLINEVLDMSKIDSGKIELQDEDFNLSELIDNLLTISKTQLEEKRHDLTVAIRAVKHEKVVGDSQKLQQVLLNLLSNSIKYTPEGGKIHLTITERPIQKPALGCFEFIVEDNGIGMSEDFITHLFDPFARAEDSRVIKTQGTGLGMSITRNIVQMMNGTIKVKSKLDEGSQFKVTVYLKLQDADDDFSYDKFINLPILVADDDEIACESTCEILDELGMQSEYVLHGQEAVQRVMKHHEADDDFFAVILDWKMPDMDGLATAKEIRRQVGDTVPIIIISAYDWSDIEASAREAGVNAFLSKPLFKSRVAYLFKTILENGSQAKGKSSLDVVQQEDFSGKRALLVEDNELNAEIAVEILKMANLEIDCAKDGKEAVMKVIQNKDGYYDIIFMDIQMPVMDGYQATREIRKLPGDYMKNLPIIAMTANAFMEDVQACRDAGMNEHIAKPIDPKLLISVLNEWLNTYPEKEASSEKEK